MRAAFPRTGGIGDGQVDTSGVVDAELVEEVEPGPNGRLEVRVGADVRVAVLAVAPGDMDMRLAAPPSVGSLFNRLGHDGLLCLAGGLGAHGCALDDYNTIIY